MTGEPSDLEIILHGVIDNGLKILEDAIVSLPLAKPAYQFLKFTIKEPNSDLKTKVSNALKDYSLTDFAIDFIGTIFIASFSNYYGLREDVNSVLLMIGIGTRFYKEIRNDFFEKGKEFFSSLESKYSSSEVYKTARACIYSIDKVLTDKVAIPLFLSGFALAGAISFFLIDPIEESKYFINTSTPQHILVPYSISNAYLKFFEGYNEARKRFGEISQDEPVNYFYKFGVALICSSIVIWELYEGKAYNYKLAIDTYGDAFFGIDGMVARYFKSPEQLFESGKKMLSKVFKKVN